VCARVDPVVQVRRPAGDRIGACDPERIEAFRPRALGERRFQRLQV